MLAYDELEAAAQPSEARQIRGPVGGATLPQANGFVDYREEARLVQSAATRGNRVLPGSEFAGLLKIGASHTKELLKAMSDNAKVNETCALLNARPMSVRRCLSRDVAVGLAVLTLEHEAAAAAQSTSSSSSGATHGTNMSNVHSQAHISSGGGDDVRDDDEGDGYVSNNFDGARKEEDSDVEDVDDGGGFSGSGTALSASFSSALFQPPRIRGSTSASNMDHEDRRFDDDDDVDDEGEEGGRRNRTRRATISATPTILPRSTRVRLPAEVHWGG